MESQREWKLAHPLEDVQEIVNMADQYFVDTGEILTKNKEIFRKNVTVASTVQLFDKTKEFLAVCRETKEDSERMLAYCWFDRFGYTTYSHEEISNAKFHHVEPDLSARLKIRLIDEMIDQHILWAYNCGIPVICSTSIRPEHDVFMKLHKRRGFTVNGSYAWIRTEEGLKCLTK